VAISINDAQQYLTELGLSLPGAISAALLVKANSVEACMVEGGADATDVTLAQLYLFGLLSISSGARRVVSQSASGASRSFTYGTLVEQMRQLKASIAVVDSKGCTVALIPAEPGGHAALFVGRSYE